MTGVPIDLHVRFGVDDRQLSTLHARAFGTGGEVVPWRDRLVLHSLTWVGAFVGPELVGFVNVCWDGGAHAFLLDTVVDPVRQRRGIGAGLVATAATEAGRAGCQWLHVDFEPHLAGFYRTACGFESTDAGLLRLNVVV